MNKRAYREACVLCMNKESLTTGAHGIHLSLCGHRLLTYRTVHAASCRLSRCCLGRPDSALSIVSDQTKVQSINLLQELLPLGEIKQGTNGLKVTRTTTNGRAGGLLARTGSLSGHPSKQQPCSTLLVPVTL
ncbi:hypothetical protein J6590_008625 [Homalodisca vitripennis]|nr:hypothetical protein J6590_008625 [Homalodisca vitripennis]